MKGASQGHRSSKYSRHLSRWSFTGLEQFNKQLRHPHKQISPTPYLPHQLLECACSGVSQASRVQDRVETQTIQLQVARLPDTQKRKHLLTRTHGHTQYVYTSTSTRTNIQRRHKYQQTNINCLIHPFLASTTKLRDRRDINPCSSFPQKKKKNPFCLAMLKNG